MNRARASRRQVLRSGGLLALSGLAAGCTSILPNPGAPLRLFRLTPKSTFDSGLPKVDWQLVIETPVAPAGLDTTRVALHRNQTELEYYARANWTDQAPGMVQILIIESFQNSGRIVAVGRESIGLRADFVLKTELREFQAEYLEPGPPKAHVRLNAILVEMPAREIVGSTRIDRVEPAEADTMSNIVGAFDAALGSALKELVTWTLTTGQEAV